MPLVDIHHPLRENHRISRNYARVWVQTCPWSITAYLSVNSEVLIRLFMNIKRLSSLASALQSSGTRARNGKQA